MAKLDEWMNTVQCMDCLEGMKQLPDGCVDLVVTDPPYAVGKAEWDSVFPNRKLWQAVYRTLKDGASLVVFAGEANLPAKLELLVSLFNYQWLWVWYKPNAMQFGKTGYSTQSIAWWFSRGSVVARPKIRDVIVCPIVPSDNDFGHPSPKPVKVIKIICNALSKKNDLILDPFMGSGTTALACKQLGRRFIGFEINPKYVDISNQRLAQEILL